MMTAITAWWRRWSPLPWRLVRASEIDRLRRTQVRPEAVLESAEAMARLMHELNQPLAIINLLAANAMANLDAPTPNIAAARAKLGRVSDQAMRAAEIVKYVRQLYRGDSGASLLKARNPPDTNPS